MRPTTKADSGYKWGSGLLLLLTMATIGIIVFIGIHKYINNHLNKIDFLWLKIVLTGICTFLLFITGIEIYSFIHFPSARRLVLRSVTFLTAIGSVTASAPMGLFALQSAHAD